MERWTITLEVEDCDKDKDILTKALRDVASTIQREPMYAIGTITDASGNIVGNCDRRHIDD